MGTIRPVQFKRTASSVVGTPGVDTSTADALNAVAQSTAIIANKFQQNELITNQVDALKTAQDITLTANEQIANQQGIANVNQQIESKESMNVQQQFFDKTARDGLNNIKNRKVRQLAKLQLAQNRVTTFNGIAKWGVKRQTLKSFNAATDGINRLSREAENVPTFNELIKSGGILEQSQQYGAAASQMLDQKEGIKLIKASNNSPVRSYIAGRTKDNPVIALIEFNSNKNIHGRFDLKEQEEIRKDINAAIKGLDPTVNMAAAFHHNTDTDDAKRLLIANDPRLYREAKERAIENGSITDQTRRFYDSGIKRSRTKGWLELPKNLIIAADIQNDMKALKDTLDEGVPVMLEDMLKIKNKILKEQGLTISNSQAIKHLSVLQMPTRDKIAAFTNKKVGFFGEPRRLKEFEREQPEWAFKLPGIDLKTGKFNINKVEIKVPDSFTEVSDITGTVWSYLTGVDWRNRVTATVSGIESVERHVEALQLPLKLIPEVRAEMVEIFLDEVVQWQDNNIEGDITQREVNDILENIIPQTAFLKGFPEIPPDGLDFIFKGNKVTIFPGGIIRKR